MRDLAEVEEELRDAGWGDSEVRGYLRGYESMPDLRSIPLSPSRPEPLPAFTGVHAPKVIARGDRGTWYRNCQSGQLKAVTEPDDPEEPARELAAAREFCDDHEFRYGRRPSMAEARLVVGRKSDGFVFSGTVEDLGRVYAQAGLPFSVVTEIQSLPAPGAVVTQPVVQG